MGAHKPKVYATDCMPPGIHLKRPIMVAATTLEQAARLLKVSQYHLARHRCQVDARDRARALAQPNLPLTAQEGT